MDELEKIKTLGEKLGYTGENLQKFVKEEVARLDKKQQQPNVFSLKQCQTSSTEQ